MIKLCEFISTNGQDVICKLYGVILGDIMRYDGHKCYNCSHRKSIKGRKQNSFHPKKFI